MPMMSKSSDVQPLVMSSTKLLRPRDIAFIEEAMRKVGLFGEVHLVIERGRVRFVRTLKSEAIDEGNGG